MSRVELPESVSTAHDLVEPALRQAAEGICAPMRRVAGYHHGWLDRTGQPTDMIGGKALRPALALLSARAAGAPARRGIPVAVAVELVHDFSLLHDDVMDGDTERRHRPTAWTVFGVSSAVLAGDAVLTAALEVLLADGSPGVLPASRALTSATQRLITGQARDLEFEGRTDVTLAECVAMAGDKTAALIACACSAGALLVGAPESLARGLARFGHDVGLAFQLVDDLLGIWGSSQITGKPVLADLRAGKKSVPVVAALNSDTPGGARLADLYLRPEPLTGEELVLAAKLVEDAGGREWTEAEAARRLAAAERHLDELNLPRDVHAEFVQIACFVTDRDR
ncbi:MAG TPA: polyprenyl synthetase family protein [Mycobacteriales bacterium]|nr:polyprenyl synthetase family protein [Mycobacteriales bacterium]